MLETEHFVTNVQLLPDELRFGEIFFRWNGRFLSPCSVDSRLRNTSVNPGLRETLENNKLKILLTYYNYLKVISFEAEKTRLSQKWKQFSNKIIKFPYRY